MSKMDNLRAMREAKFERGSAQPAAPRSAAARSKTAPVAPATSAAPDADRGSDAVEEGAAGLCGHRAISGRTCTRERGHAAKSHRYS